MKLETASWHSIEWFGPVWFLLGFITRIFGHGFAAEVGRTLQVDVSVRAVQVTDRVLCTNFQ